MQTVSYTLKIYYVGESLRKTERFDRTPGRTDGAIKRVGFALLTGCITDTIYLVGVVILCIACLQVHFFYIPFFYASIYFA